MNLDKLQESWKVIEQFPDYAISDLGRVRSLSARKGSRAMVNHGIIKNSVQEMKGGYRRARVSLRRNGKTYQLKVHTLVLEAFVGIKPEGMVSLHINGDALDNRASNLRWGTMVENSADAVRHGTKTKPPVHSGQSHPLATISDEDILRIRSHVFTRGDQAAIARQYGVADITISRIRKGFSRPSL